MDFNIRTNVMGKGLDGIAKTGEIIASEIEQTDGMNQIDMLKLQQKMSNYTNTIALMTNMLKGLADTDKEVIRNT